MKIKKKPVEVHGWPVNDLLDIAKEGAAYLPPRVRVAYLAGTIDFEPDHLIVATLEGVMHGPRGWWLIEGVAGEFYPCDGEAFVGGYDVVGDDENTVTATPIPEPKITGPYDHAPE